MHMSTITGWGKGSVTGVTITRMNFHAFCPGPPSHPLENNEKMRMRNGDGPMNVFLLDGEQRPKDIFFFSSVPAHVFLLTSRLLKYCTTASASLSTSCCPECCLFCKSLVLRLGETVILRGSWRHLLCHRSFGRVIRQFTRSTDEINLYRKKYIWVSSVRLSLLPAVLIPQR